MSPYLDASSKGVPFCWSCTKNDILREHGLTPVSKWKLVVLKYKQQLLINSLESS